MKVKIPKSFNVDKWLLKIEPPARTIIWPFVMILAILTVVPNISNLTELTGLILLIYLILFFIATTIVFLIDVRPLSHRQPSNQQENTGRPAYTEQSDRNRWISIGLLVLVTIVIGLIFVARQLPPTPQGYQAFFTAGAAIGAFVTGIALAVFAYQQYKLRQTEHRLVFQPHMLLRTAGAAIPGEIRYNNMIYPYGIEWTVIILNTSQQPILIEFMALKIRLWQEDPNKPSKDEYLSIPSYHVLEPDRLEPPFQVTLNTPQRIRWIIEGYDASHDLDYISGDSGNRYFELIFKVRATIQQDPTSTPIIMETVSNPFRVPKDAKWGNPTPYIQ